jgi:hypothetical protein
MTNIAKELTESIKTCGSMKKRLNHNSQDIKG